MNKKTKKYFFWVAAGLTIIVVSLFLFVAISVKINGRYKIEIITVNERNVDYKINAEGVFGSISEFQSDNGILYLEGYYKNIDIVIDDVKIEEIQSLVILDKKNVLKLSVEEFESDIQGKSLILKTNNSFNQKKNFFRKSSEIIAFELAKPIFIDIVLSLGFFCILISLFLLIKKIRKYDKTKMKSFSKSGLTSIGVFFLGFVFWLIVVLVLLEITLRIIGFAFNNAEAETKISNDDGKFVVLCIGDSFTYGVGSTNGNDYPAHLQKLLQENTNKEVIVVNRGRCAQNSSQIIEKLQEDLNSCQPNLVIMLFGMANSWNYYGFQILDNYWEKIRIVKLFKRISYNLKYKGASTDTNQNVKDYALSFLIKSFEFPRFGTDADKYYYYVGRYYLALRNWENSFRYLSFALSKNQSNINCFEALKVCLREYDNEKHYNSDLGLIDTTVIAESIAKLDSLISKYPDVHAIRTLKELYLFEKEHSKITDITLGFYRNCILEGFSFNSIVFIEHNLNISFDSLYNFYLSARNNENKQQIDLTLAWLNISEKRFTEAKSLLKIDSFTDSISRRLCVVADNIVDFAETNKAPHYMMENSKLPSSKYRELFDSSVSDDKFKIGIKQIFEYLSTQDNSENQTHFLPHVLKRTANVEQSGIFGWINSDIIKAVEICLKQNYPVICMNYPLIPPPNSEEIHFWADSVGGIWKETSNKYGLLFVDNESIFKSLGKDQNLYFEPHKTGSEHCNDSGYKLMAQNILSAMKLNEYLK